ncbi:MAG: fibronectin type III domain-containing protein [Mogibacterium sp.]|nr:fibronectin type III domain-containing protein [Mogibacterium sp.]
MKKGKRLLVVLLATLTMVIGAVSMSYASESHYWAIGSGGGDESIEFRCNKWTDDDGTASATIALESALSSGSVKYDGSGHGLATTPVTITDARHVGDNSIYFDVETINYTGTVYPNTDEEFEYNSGKKPTKVGNYEAHITVYYDNGSSRQSTELKKAFSIVQKEVTLTWEGPFAFTYDGDEHAPEATSEDFVYGDEVYVDVTGKTDSNAKTREPKYTATASLAGDDAYNYVFAEGVEIEHDFWIDQKGVTVSGITAEGKTYDGTSDATLKYEGLAQIEGIVSGEQVFVNSATGYFYDGSDGPKEETEVKDAGNGIRIKLEADTYDSETDHKVTEPGTVTLGGNDKENYYVKKVQTNLKGNIAPLPAQIVWESDDEDVAENPDHALIYNGKYQAPTAKVDNLIGSDGLLDITVKVNGAKIPAGREYGAKAVKINGSSNYTLQGADNLETEFSIYPRKVALTWIGDKVDVEDNKVYSDGLIYNGKEQAPTIDIQKATETSSDGLIDGDDLDLTIEGAKVDSNAKAKVAYYPAKATFTNPNYTLDDPLKKRVNKTETEFKIYQKSVESVSWTDTHKGETSPMASDGVVFTYDGKFHYMEAHPKSSAIVPGDEPVTITVVHQDVKPGQEEPVFVDNNRWIDANVKSETSKYVAHAESLSDLNYTFSEDARYPDTVDVKDMDCKFNIDQLEADFSWDKTKFTYDGQHQQPKGTITNLQDNEETGKTDECEVEKYWYRITSDGALGDLVEMTIDAGTYRVYPVVLSDTNYRPKFSLDPLFWDHEDYRIFARPVELKWTPSAREFTYDANKHEYSAEVTNVVKEREDTKEADVVETVLGGIYAEANAGSYTAKVAELVGSDGVTPAENYTLLAKEIDGDETTKVKDASINWKINKKDLTVTVYDKTGYYGDDPATYVHGVKYTGLVNGDANKDDNNGVPGTYDANQFKDPEKPNVKAVVEGALAYSCKYKQYGKPGKYAVSASGLTSDNYNIKFVDGTLTIKDRNLAGDLVAKAKAGNKKATISWKKVKGAAKYQIYFSPCNKGNKKYTPKLYKTVSSSKKSYTIKKLKKNTYYKFYVVALDSSGKRLAKTEENHFCTNNVSEVYTNPKSVTASKTKVTVKKGGTYKVKTTVTKVRSDKRLTNGTHTKKVRYRSAAKTVATVSKNGTIKGVETGWCRVYTMGANGIWQVIEVTVK